ncbi:MAG: type II toxin-antitoxin system RelE/ParE family toxin [Chlorobiaceae bacterium]|nr:type II toxin-antitoxin system RelE/ParE family toxin [Chlorobiaceae bacterium]
MRAIEFYTSRSGGKPIEEFLDSLTAKEAQKVVWVLDIVRKQQLVSKEYFKKLTGSDGIWEVRASHGRKEFRLLCFFPEGKLVILTNGFVKKSQKTPEAEIELAQKRKADYIRRHING